MGEDVREHGFADRPEERLGNLMSEAVDADQFRPFDQPGRFFARGEGQERIVPTCLLYTSDAADEL